MPQDFAQNSYLHQAFSRLKTKVMNNLSWIYKGQTNSSIKKLWRRPELEILDRYLNNSQYAHLQEWSPDVSSMQHDLREEYQPKFIFPLPEIAASIFNSLLTSEEARLNFRCMEGGFSTTEEINTFLEDTMFWPLVSSFIPTFLTNGSVFLRISSTGEGNIRFHGYNTKWVYPEFDSSGDLVYVKVQLIYDTGEDDANGERILRWQRFDLGQDNDIMFDSPRFRPNDPIPDFKAVDTVKHNMGFVQGVWIKTSVTQTEADVDGKSFLLSGLDYLDGFNYLSSKEDASIFFHLLPSVVSYGVDPESILQQRKNAKSIGEKNQLAGLNWLAVDRPPDQGAVNFLESSGVGLGLGEQYHIRSLQLLQYIHRIILLDPERMAAHAQSGVAMEVLHRPVLEYIKQIRPFIKKGLCDLLYKAETVSASFGTNQQLKPGTIMNCEKKWGSFFTNTIADVAQKVSYSAMAVQSRVISRKTALEHIAEDFGVEDTEEELALISQDEEAETELLNMGGGLQGGPQSTAQKKPAAEKKPAAKKT